MREYASIIGIVVLLLVGYVFERYVPIFGHAREVARQAEMIEAESRRSQVQYAVDALGLQLKAFCMKNRRAPTAEESATFVTPTDLEAIEDPRFDNVSFEPPVKCRGQLLFKARSNHREMSLPLPLATDWRYEE